jgi:hypothetical protein
LNRGTSDSILDLPVVQVDSDFVVSLNSRFGPWLAQHKQKGRPQGSCRRNTISLRSWALQLLIATFLLVLIALSITDVKFL